MKEKNKDKLNKILVPFVGLLLIALLIVNIKSCLDAKAERRAIQQDMIEMKRLSDNVVRSQSQYVSKEDLEALAKELNLNLGEIKEDLDQYDARVQAISKILVSSLGRQGTNIPSTGTTPRPQPQNPDTPTQPSVPCPDGSEVECPDPFGFLTHSQHLNLTEPFSNEEEVPIGSVTFEAWKKNPWSIDIRPRDYHVTTVIGQDRQGRHYTYHKFEIGVDGTRYPVEIKDAQLVEELPESAFSWWNPRVGIGIHGGIGFNTSPLPDQDLVTGVVVPNISFSPFSYGPTETKPTWVFARIGVGVDAANQSADFSLAPAMWNIGSGVDFIQNTYLGPVVSVDHTGRVGVSLGITTDF